MAISALRRTVVWNREPRVVKHRARPRRCVMASRAGRGESSRQVVWICGACVIRLVAGITIGRGSHKDVIDVATCARDSDVRSGQREGRVVVIKDRARPRGC